jgi:hypothetical protein
MFWVLHAALLALGWVLGKAPVQATAFCYVFPWCFLSSSLV